MKRFSLLLITFLSVLGGIVLSQSVQADELIWQDVPEVALRSSGQRQIVPSDYRLVRTDFASLTKQLVGKAEGESFEMVLPLPNGEFGRFQVAYAPIMAPELAAKYPQIRTYRGQGLGDPTATVRFDTTPSGFHAMIMSADGTIYIDPYQNQDIDHYISYHKRDLAPSTPRPEDSILPSTRRAVARAPQAIHTVGSQLRTFELAMSVTGEFTAWVCAQAGTTCTNDTERRAAVMAHVTTGLNRVTQIYEVELAISFTLIANTDQLYFTDAATDPYTTSTGDPASDVHGDFPSAVASVGTIAPTAYDLGHVLHTGGGGVASTFWCGDGSETHADKATGMTGSNQPINDPFWVDFVAHEIGHQFNAAHSFNATGPESQACTNRMALGAYEPGSGTTIMGYAGICGTQNVQPNSDAMFNAGAYQQIQTHVSTGDGSGCATVAATGNTPPTVNAGSDYTIPRDTPFRLTAVGSDSEQATSALTTSWEWFSLGTEWTAGTTAGTILPNTDQRDNLFRPILRVFPPSSSMTRVVPSLANILDGTYQNNGEELPSIDQTITFRATMRDNAASGGGVNFDDMQLTVEDAAGPFRVTSHAAATTLPQQQATTVTWDVANTTAAPVSCAQVDIELSLDGGVTFPNSLATNTANDGSESVTIPNVTTAQGRIQVRCSNNIFFDINKGNLTIGSPPQAGIVVDSLLGTGAPGICVLDDALFAADSDQATNGCAAGSGADTITFSVTGTINLDNGLFIESDVTVNGDNRIVINGGNTHRLLTVNSGTSTLNGLTLQNGQGVDDCDYDLAPPATVTCGGAISVADGAILTVNDSVLTGNRVGVSGEGGAIHNSGTLNITNSTLSGNQGDTADANSFSRGGAVANFGTLNITNSTLSNNTAYDGGAINNRGGNAVTTITSSTVSGNTATGNGGGVYNADVGAGNALNVYNSTFSGNSAPANAGGAINQLATATLINSTFNNNTGGGLSNAATTNVSNSILANSPTGQDCENIAPGTVNLTGSNIIETNTGCGAATTTDPNLVALAANSCTTQHRTAGGLACVQTHALNTGSPAIGNGNATICTNPPISDIDQRGTTRAGINAPCDIGAYELLVTPSAVTFSTGFSGVVSNRAITVILIVLLGLSSLTWALLRQSAIDFVKRR